MALADAVEVLLRGDAVTGDATDERILQVAVERFTRFGIARTNADDIAKAARVNRTTLYRRIGTKDDLVIAAMAYEVNRMRAEVVRESEAIDDSVERLLHGFVATLETLRGNRWIQQLIRDGEVQLLLDDDQTLFRAGTAMVAERIRQCWNDIGHDGGDADTIGAILARLIHSFVTVPAAAPVLATTEQIQTFADIYVRALIFSTG
ncbi:MULTISPECIES: TetR/AcrR family transcriptional regulator [Mycolicibacterium]|uniref:TetR/AcrR family transcriptional regulator n=1 Tax=Mycolicibacterium monacense TaxID=85693 RepID=UPI0007E9337C|nr:TetR/AcrR family transcriptional regulator [Mycolicibacterium monacense]OBB72796.1 TetR family transcriptional regulator [Mycolicibacterium monacense]